jgi:hypothetical protein
VGLSAFALACCAMALRTMMVGASTDHPSVRKSAPPAVKGLIPHWTGIFDVTGHCRFSVPPTWKVAYQLHGNALTWAPDGSATALQNWSPSTTWALYTSALRRTLKPTTVQEDSRERVWFEYAAEYPGVHDYVAVPSAGGVCAAQIDVKASANDALKPIIRQIAQSVVALR